MQNNEDRGMNRNSLFVLLIKWRFFAWRSLTNSMRNDERYLFENISFNLISLQNSNESPAQTDIFEEMQFSINSICRWPNIVTHLPFQRWNASIHAKFMSTLTYSESTNIDDWKLLHPNDTLRRIWMELSDFSDFPCICVQKVSTWAHDSEKEIISNLMRCYFAWMIHTFMEKMN